MHCPNLVAFCLAAPIVGLLASCRNIPEAPRHSQRTELEIAVTIEPAFAQALAAPDAKLTRAIEAAIVDEADVGLRFYPVLAQDYQSGQARPAYRMAVDLRGLAVDLHESTEPPRTSVERLTAAITVALHKNRPNAPALLVARAEHSAERRPATGSASGSVEASYSVTGASSTVVSQDAIVAAVRAAVRKSLGEMVRAIDREFELADRR